MELELLFRLGSKLKKKKNSARVRIIVRAHVRTRDWQACNHDTTHTLHFQHIAYADTTHLHTLPDTNAHTHTRTHTHARTHTHTHTHTHTECMHRERVMCMHSR